MTQSPADRIPSDPKPEVFKQPQTPELINHYEREEKLEDYLKTLKGIAEETKRKIYTSEQEVDLAAEHFNTEINQGLFEHPERLKTPVRISGEGVSEPDTSTDIVKLPDGNKGVLVQFDPDNGYRTVPYMDARVGFLESIFVQPVGLLDEHNMPNGQYILQLRYVVRAGAPEVRSITMEASHLDVSRVNVWHAFLAVIETVDIQALKLYEMRQKLLFADQLAAKGILGSNFEKYLGMVRSAMGNEAPYTFNELAEIEHLKAVCRSAARIAKKSPEHAEVVKQALFEVLPLGKHLLISGVSQSPRIVDGSIQVNGEVHGVLWDILLPTSEDDVTKPALILDEEGDGNSSRLYIFDIEDIDSFKY
jgi:hypothetical protein